MTALRNIYQTKTPILITNLKIIRVDTVFKSINCEDIPSLFDYTKKKKKAVHTSGQPFGLALTDQKKFRLIKPFSFKSPFS